MTFTYPEVGATEGKLPPGYHHVRVEEPIGSGEACFHQAVERLFTWNMHRGAGLRVDPATPRVAPGVVVRPRWLGLSAPCQVVSVRLEPRAAGFTYGTLKGHPEMGEERFTLVIDSFGQVRFEVLAFSRPARWFVRLGGPVPRAIQGRITRRYIEAMQSI